MNRYKDIRNFIFALLTINGIVLLITLFFILISKCLGYNCCFDNCILTLLTILLSSLILLSLLFAILIIVDDRYSKHNKMEIKKEMIDNIQFLQKIIR